MYDYLKYVIELAHFFNSFYSFENNEFFLFPSCTRKPKYCYDFIPNYNEDKMDILVYSSNSLSITNNKSIVFCNISLIQDIQDVVCLVRNLSVYFTNTDDLIDNLTSSIRENSDRLSTLQVKKILDLYNNYGLGINEESYCITLLWSSITFVI